MEKGFVVEAQNNKLTIRFASSDACKKCGACMIKDGNSLMTGIENSVNAKIGDTVFIENKAGNTLTAASIIYLLPVISLVVGYIAGAGITNTLGLAGKYAVLIALLVFAASFPLIGYIDKKIAKNPNFKPVIVKKV